MVDPVEDAERGCGVEEVGDVAAEPGPPVAAEEGEVYPEALADLCDLVGIGGADAGEEGDPRGDLPVDLHGKVRERCERVEDVWELCGIDLVCGGLDDEEHPEKEGDV